MLSRVDGLVYSGYTACIMWVISVNGNNIAQHNAYLLVIRFKMYLYTQRSTELWNIIRSFGGLRVEQVMLI